MIAYDITLAVPRRHLEIETEKRLRCHHIGSPGICAGRATGDGICEIVYRDALGVPVGVMGYTDDTVTDFCVARHRRREGVATRMLAHLRARGVSNIRGPFTDDGAAFVKARS